ncbi:tail protein X [Sulfurivirga sp.]|uniref:tail protein X n=1 Tax=Sulfurivirga sp. TaxID=2614236 RepID=UPI0025D1E614|nr:tail protein X [Sulfurivirga sp.]
MNYVTTDGDMLDEICHRLLGDEHRVVEVLALNPGLADQPVPLPAGVVIELPEAAPAPDALPAKDVVADVWG